MSVPRYCSRIFAFDAEDRIYRLAGVRFKRIRHYGVLGPAGKAAKLAQARAALSAPIPDRLAVESLETFMQRVDRIEWMRCAHCGRGSFVPSAPLAPVRLPPLRGPP